MTGKSIVIIGAGIAGLSAGCYAQMNGFQSTIFESHEQPGGLCTSWRRGRYVFDGCIDWLVGTSPRSAFNRIWSELGALEGRKIVEHEEFARYEGTDGRQVVFYSDVDRLESHLAEVAPEDTAAIRDLTNGIRRMASMDMPVDMGLLDWVRMGLKILPAMKAMRKYAAISMEDYAGSFSSRLLREALIAIFGLPEFPAAGLMMPLALRNAGDGGYPVGGSLEFSKAIARRYSNLGGRIHYRSRVERILAENGRAAGVRLADGTEHRADYVVSAADGHATIFEMLEGQYIDAEIRRMYEGGLEPFPSMIQVSLGVARDFTGQPKTLCFALPEPIEIAGQMRSSIGVRHFSHDSTMAPGGKSSLVVSFLTDYEYWRALAQDPEHYRSEKERIAKQVIAELDRRFPGLSGQVEVVDVATPMTYERYTGNWRASFEGWLITTKTMPLMMRGEGIPKSLPGLSGFHMIGQWTTIGGGLPPAAKDGRDVIRKICRAEKRGFHVSLPEAG